jgi:UDP-glucose:(heptosyl)LPS alpha-1,3-glucosyltransferase
VREQLGIPPDGRVVVFVGTGFRRKGLERLLELWGSGLIREVYLLIVGNDSQLAQYRREWQRPDVFFVGPQPRVEDYCAAADLLVLPSVQEAFGNVVLEALAAGLPVVTVRGVGAADGLHSELLHGILENPDDPMELRDKIAYLLDAERWPMLSREARLVAEGYTWEKYLDRLEEQFEAMRVPRKSYDRATVS